MKNCIHIFFVAVFLFLFSFTVQAQTIRVNGTVKGNNGERLVGVTVTDIASGKVIGITDEDGKYSVLISPKSTLKFTSMGYTDNEIKVNGRQVVDVILKSTAIKIKEVAVTAKFKNKIIFEPTDIEVVGNYFHLRTRFKVPDEMFGTNTRLIIQPTIYNISKKESKLLTPVVNDGREYRLTQDRMLEFNMKENDPLAPYERRSEMTRKGEVIAYHDSAYVSNMRDDFRSDVKLTIENYNKILFVDSFQIARGLVNPMRFFEYNVVCRDMTDRKYWPKPELQLRNDKGEVHLTFAVGKSRIDDKNPNNAKEIAKLNNRLSEIEKDPNAKLLSFHISGMSSPDGRLAQNEKLAQERMKEALSRITSRLSPVTLEFLDIHSDAKVDTWHTAVQMMRDDGLTEEAEKVQAIIDKYPNKADMQWRAVIKLPFYRKVIVPNILPRMRKVEYNFSYSIYRYLTDEEIKSLYEAKGYKELSRHEFWRMFAMAKDDKERETLYKQALEVYPKYTLAANSLAALYLRQNRTDVSILEPFVSKNAPEEVLINQTLMLLNDFQYSKADSIVSLISEEDDIEEIRAVTRALNGNYQEALNRYAKDGGINEVVLLLALKRNEEAWEKAKLLPADSAKAEYLKAVAANRLDRIMDAMNHLENAFELDPSLKEIAKADGDIMDLL